MSVMSDQTALAKLKGAKERGKKKKKMETNQWI